MPTSLCAMNHDQTQFRRFVRHSLFVRLGLPLFSMRVNNVVDNGDNGNERVGRSTSINERVNHKTILVSLANIVRDTVRRK